jgi:hypothetical protein
MCYDIDRQHSGLFVMASINLSEAYRRAGYRKQAIQHCKTTLFVRRCRTISRDTRHQPGALWQLSTCGVHVSAQQTLATGPARSAYLSINQADVQDQFA